MMPSLTPLVPSNGHTLLWSPLYPIHLFHPSRSVALKPTLSESLGDFKNTDAWSLPLRTSVR